MTDPYKVLGVSPNATDAEVKKAYYALAKKYHPDAYRDNPLKDLADEKMKEINEAYDTITKQRQKNSSSNGSGTYQNGYGGQSYSGSAYQNGSVYYRVRVLIQNGRYAEAEVLLANDPNKGHTAEWFYLYGILCLRKGAMYEARTNIENACRMDPQNPEYAEALNALNNNNYTDYDRYTGARNCSMCDLCAGLMCANMCCRC